MADTPEKKVKKKVVEILKQYNAYYFYPVTGGFGASGVPDIVTCVKGRFLGIEVKADAKKRGPTALQQKNLNEINATGGIGLVIDANNLDELTETLDAIGD
ncbi:MAG TPA: VRR-NUC domain-containing protein [Candidatus Paceibacterota bacterium]|nr:VRR-NUC domain-containing protein [Candidatus Paceibacterota bacterium]